MIESFIEPLLFRSILQMDTVLQAPNVDVPASAEVHLDTEAIVRDAHEQGRQEALIIAEAAFEERLEAEHALLSCAIKQFEEEKQKYFSEVEEEVIKLSLAIAERVLHRETEMDPKLLAGVVRVALDQVKDTSEAVLQVPIDDATRWQQMLELAGSAVSVEPGESLSKGEAILKTRSGSVQLGIKSQLQEIERGFFDLLTRRPVAPAL